MAQVIITRASGPVTLGGGPLAADTDFQVTDGSCRMTTGAFSADNDGFRFEARAAGRDSWRAAAGRTVTVQTDMRAVIVFEQLG